MSEEPTLPGFEAAPGSLTPHSATPVRDGYADAVAELRRRQLLGAEHDGLIANLLRLGEIIDRERKGYAVAHASSQAHDIMKTLLASIPKETGDAFGALLEELDRVHPKPGG